MKKNKFYADFMGISKAEIKDELEKNKWSGRKISWEDYEFKNSWSEFILEGSEEEPLLNGILFFNEANIKTLDKLFMNLKGKFRYEIYSDQKLVLEKENEN